MSSFHLPINEIPKEYVVLSGKIDEFAYTPARITYSLIKAGPCLAVLVQNDSILSQILEQGTFCINVMSEPLPTSRISCKIHELGLTAVEQGDAVAIRESFLSIEFQAKRHIDMTGWTMYLCEQMSQLRHRPHMLQKKVQTALKQPIGVNIQ